MNKEQIRNIQEALNKYPHRREEIMLRLQAAQKLSKLVTELGGTLGLFQEFQRDKRKKDFKE